MLLLVIWEIGRGLLIIMAETGRAPSQPLLAGSALDRLHEFSVLWSETWQRTKLPIYTVRSGSLMAALTHSEVSYLASGDGLWNRLLQSESRDGQTRCHLSDRCSRNRPCRDWSQRDTRTLETKPLLEISKCFFFSLLFLAGCSSLLLIFLRDLSLYESFVWEGPADKRISVKPPTVISCWYLYEGKKSMQKDGMRL